MDWVETILGFWTQTALWMAGLAVVLGMLARVMPCNPGMVWWKNLRALRTDLVYWLVVPVFILGCRTALLVAGMVLLFDGKQPDALPVRDLPLWAQCGLVLLIQDVVLYWLHRAFHTRRGWHFHAVHHSPEHLDWTAATRFHPANTLLEFTLTDVAVLMLGFSPEAVVVLAPFNIALSAVVHANLNWTFGPLKYVLASPVFHRWHHTSEAEGRDRNFAPTFPFLDLAFGTFHLPAGRVPVKYGADGAGVTRGFWGQLVHPLRASEWARRRPVLARAAVAATLAVVGLSVWWADEVVRVSRAAEVLAAAPSSVGLVAADPTPPAAREVPAAVVTAVAVSADGRRVVRGGNDGTVRLWDAETAAPVALPGHARKVTAVAVSADGKRVVSASQDGVVRLWDADAGRGEVVPTGHIGVVLGAAVSADGGVVVTGGGDGTVRMRTADGRSVAVTAGTGAVTGVAVSPDGRVVAAACTNEAKVWGAAAGPVTLSGHANLVFAVAVSPDGRRVATADYNGVLKVWDAATGREQLTLTGHTGPVYGVAFTLGGRQLVSGGQDKVVRVWDASTGRVVRSHAGHTDAVTGVAAGGGWVVSGSRDRTVRAWDQGDKEPATIQPASYTEAP